MSLSIEERRKKYNISATPFKPIFLQIKYIPKVYGYIRVSTAKQAKDGISLESQKIAINKYCEDEHLPEPIFFDDKGLSGKSIANRPEFQRLCSLVRPEDIIVTYSLSRLGRNARQILTFMHEMELLKVKVICTKDKFDTTTSGGKLMLNVLASINEFELAQTRDRSMDAIKNLKEAGKLRTKPHFGWVYNGKGKDRIIIEVPEEQAVINFLLQKVTENPKIRDSQLTRLVNDEITAGTLIYRNKQCICDKQVNRIIKHNNLRNDANDAS